MQDRPTARELLDAVREFLAGGRHADAFLLRVATNALGIVAREIALGPAFDAGERERLRALVGRDGTLDELNRDLARRIRAGLIGNEALPHLTQTIEEKLLIANPGYVRQG